jgi:hypothetical protein
MTFTGLAKWPKWTTSHNSLAQKDLLNERCHLGHLNTLGQGTHESAVLAQLGLTRAYLALVC